jgi:hypothetical protein
MKLKSLLRRQPAAASSAAMEFALSQIMFNADAWLAAPGHDDEGEREHIQGIRDYARRELLHRTA